MTMNKYNAVLIVGPTGSGKTPLGDYLEANGLWGRRCFHFDFGAQLRRIAALPPGRSPFSRKEMETISLSLRTGTLLENEAFPLAEKILRAFIRERGLRPTDLLILNGFPRHVGQADDMAGIAAVKAVASLDGQPGVIIERIRRDSGGDRGGRADDAIRDINKRLEVFRLRTAPLLEHYWKKKVQVVSLAVGLETKAEDLARRLETLGILKSPKPGKKPVEE